MTEDEDLKTAENIVTDIQVYWKCVQPINFVKRIHEALKQARAEGFKAGISQGIDAVTLLSNPTY